MKTKMTVDGKGLRYDSGKLRLDLIPADVEAVVAEVFTNGAQKYAPRNWERGMAWSKAYGPLRRHLNAWTRGEKNDAESGCPHLAHVIVNAMFLLAFELRHVGINDIEEVLRAAPKKWRR